MTQPQGDAGQSGNDGQAASGSTGDGEFTPITSQEDLNKVLGDRLARERAKFADYDDLKAKAGQLDALADASKTETDLLRDELEAIKSERAAERLETTRLKIANAHGITDAEDLAALNEVSTEESITILARRFAARDADRKKNGNHVPNEGASAPVGGNADRAFARSLLGGGD